MNFPTEEEVLKEFENQKSRFGYSNQMTTQEIVTCAMAAGYVLGYQKGAQEAKEELIQDLLFDKIRNGKANDMGRN